MAASIKINELNSSAILSYVLLTELSQQTFRNRAPTMSFSEMSRIANVLRASLCVMYRAGDCADNAMQYVFEFFSFHMVLRNPRFRPFLIGIMSSNVSEHI
ncbi:unnamed protein product [Albugo candida]|uniref:Uncharacterized protein n=1 Tax=Albugo candida TaxID=65357 RepID=A0A024FVF0_9STRA|nr:unnamed protein product [Albugo candida]|eukprot:CCI11100.1 unnamed protein product [Albugo candida]